MTLLRRWLGRSEAGILLLGVLVLGLVGAVAYTSSSAFARDVPLAGVTQDIELRLTLSHLWLEEILGGDESVDVQDEIYGNIDRAGELCRAMMNGGPTRFGRIDPVGGGAGHLRLTQLCDGIEDFRVLAGLRLGAVATSRPGSSNDRAYDAAFERLLDLADADNRRHGAPDLP